MAVESNFHNNACASDPHDSKPAYEPLTGDSTSTEYRMASEPMNRRH